MAKKNLARTVGPPESGGPTAVVPIGQYTQTP
jgi:hypothetical protein